MTNKERVGIFAMFLAGAAIAASGARDGGLNARIKVPLTDWSVRAGLVIGDKDQLERPLESYTTRDVREQDNFIDVNPTGHIGPVGILGSLAVGGEKNDTPLNASINVEQ